MTERDAILFLIKGPVGYEVGVELDIMIRRLPDGNYIVEWECENETYNCAEDAVDFFLDKRREMRRGFDFPDEEEQDADCEGT